MCIFVAKFAEVAQLVEHNLAKVRVADSSSVFRSIRGCSKTSSLIFNSIKPKKNIKFDTLKDTG